MRLKSIVILMLVSFLVFTIAASSSYAFGYSKKKGLEDKFSSKVKMILKNEEELGLTDKQIDKIKKIKIDTKKDIIRKNAEINILALDIKQAMMQDDVDTRALNSLIDEKYDLKKEMAKTLAGACVELKNILTKDQKDKMKELYKKCKKDKMKNGGMMKDKMNCPMKNKMMQN